MYHYYKTATFFSCTTFFNESFITGGDMINDVSGSSNNKYDDDKNLLYNFFLPFFSFFILLLLWFSVGREFQRKTSLKQKRQCIILLTLLLDITMIMLGKQEQFPMNFRLTFCIHNALHTYSNKMLILSFFSVLLCHLSPSNITDTLVSESCLAHSNVCLC